MYAPPSWGARLLGRARSDLPGRDRRKIGRNGPDEEKIRSAAAVAVHQKYGATISPEQREAMIVQVMQVIANDAEMRARIIESMNQILLRER